MIGRLFHFLFAAVLYFSLGTVIAEGIIVSYLSSQWQLDREKIARMVAVARGLDAGPPAAPPSTQPDDAAYDQVSYEQVLQARAMRDKNLQLREQALTHALAQLQADRQKLADEQKRFQRDRTEYETKLAAVAQGAQNAGREEVRRILQSIKPKQAKEILVGMLDNNELDEVVALLSGMTDSKRSKILAEFKTADENKKIDEVLRRIRKGAPEAPLAQQAKEKLLSAGPASGTPLPATQSP